MGEYTSTPECTADVAICGIGLRLPGGIRSPSELYDFLVSGKDARGLPDVERYNASAFTYTSDGGQTRALPAEGYWLEWKEITGWDPSPFASIGATISKAEMEQLDPQQRLLLRVVWETLESAAEHDWQLPHKANRIGCYVGSFGDDWRDLRARDSVDHPKYRLLGHTDFALSNRVSHCFGLGGPSITVRAACAAAGVALHLACQAIKNGECDAAIVAGSNVVLSPEFSLFLAEQGVLSPDASCRTFDANASGYARAEAINCVYIKRHDLAVQDGNPIRAIIRGSGTSAGGRTAGMSTPNPEAQAALIRNTYRHAGISADEMSRTAMVECHGTGTVVGDAVEACALANVFGEKGIIIGSVKPALGHSEGASALTSVIKAILSLEHGKILPNIKFESPNLQIPFSSGNLVVPSTPQPWPIDRLERIGVSSFGIGGSQVHIIVDSARSLAPLHPTRVPRHLSNTKHKSMLCLLMLSAASENSLTSQYDLVKEYCAHQTNAENLERLAFTLNHHRIQLPLRTFCVVDESGEVRYKGRPFSRPKPSSPAVILVFPGCGTQWARMGVELLKSDSDFLQDIQAMDKVLNQLPAAHKPSWSIRSELIKPDTQSRLGDEEYSQTVTTALQLAITNLLRRYGVHAGAVIGHANGEVAAAYAAGAVSLGDAIKIAYYSSRRQTKEDEGYRILVSSSIRPRQPSLPFYSSVSGQILKTAEEFGPMYWSRNRTLDNVSIDKAARPLLDPSCTCIYVEIGPTDAETTAHMQKILDKTGNTSCAYISTLKRTSSARIAVLTALGELHSNGVDISLPKTAQDGTSLTPLTDLGPYPWHLNKHYWPQSSAMNTWRLRASPPHELLGIRGHDDSDVSPTWRCLFSVDNVPWMRDHVIGDDILFPFAAFIAIAGEVAFQLSGERAYTVRDLNVSTALVLVPGSHVEMVTWARPETTASHPTSREHIWWEFAVQTCSDNVWTQHCTGRVRPGRGFGGLHLDSTYSIKEDDFARIVEPTAWYGAMARVGYKYGPAFQKVRDIKANIAARTVRVKIQECTREDESQKTSYLVHPATLDNVIQSLIIANHGGQPRQMRQIALPTYLEKIFVGPESINEIDSLEIYAHIESSNNNGSSRGSLIASTLVALEMPNIAITDLHFTALQSLDGSLKENHGAVQMVWKPDIDLMDPKSLLRARNDPQQAELQSRLEALSLLCAAEIHHIVAESTLTIIRNLPEHMKKLLAWIDWLLATREQYATISTTSKHRQAEIQRQVELLQGTPAYFAAELLSRCALHAAEILDASSSPLALFLQDDALHRLYDWWNSLWSYQSFLALLSHQRGKHLRILEIGAGTGGLTARVLEQLKESAEDGQLHGTYVFTDISSGFFAGAKERFKSFSSMIEYRVLDIGQDPMKQGFKGEYDLVIASNVLHATPDVNQTLRNVRSLLGPNGRLLLQELACESKWINLIMGFLSGWWLGQSDDRAFEPYISPQLWDQRLQLAGFEPLQSCVMDVDAPYQINATMLVRAATAPPERQNITLLCGGVHDDGCRGLVEALHLELSHLGFTVTRASFAQDTDPIISGHIISLLDLGVSGSLLDDISGKRLSKLIQLIRRIEKSKSTLLWLTRPCQVAPVPDPSFAQVLGFARSVRQETSVDFVTLEVESPDAANLPRAVCKLLVTKILPARSASHHEDLEVDKEFVYICRDDTVLIPRFSWASIPQALVSQFTQRLVPKSEAATSKVLQIAKPGQLDSLAWALRRDNEKPTNCVAVQVEAAGLNFKDVLVAMGTEGVRRDESLLGCEAAGLVTSTSGSKFKPGDRVMVFAPMAQCIATAVQVPEHLCARIPDHLTTTEAAGLPCIFITVLRGLIHKAGLQQGQTVLIHSATGGVGLAAIQIAQWVGATIFATVGSDAKVNFLVHEMGIPREHIFNSRDESFVNGLMSVTKGRGVDVVLNSLSGPLLHASWQCVAPCGTFVELGKRDIMSHGKLAMRSLAENRSFVAIDMAHLAMHDNSRGIISQLLEQVVDLYGRGIITPVTPLQVFPAHDALGAFRKLEDAATHMGKIVISIGPTSFDATIPLVGPNSIPSLPFSQKDVYILVGGLRGLTASIARWMACLGARHIAFLSRSAATSFENGDRGAVQIVTELRALGCHVRMLKCDVTCEKEVKDTLARIQTTCRIRGLVHLAAVLADTSLDGMSHEKWCAATCPKVLGTWNLHRALPKDVDFFVLVSSMLGVTGREGQANYAAASSFLNSFVQYRRRLGLACSVLDVGVVQDVGTLTNRNDVLEAMQRSGVQLLNEQDVLDGVQLAIVRSPVEQHQEIEHVAETPGAPEILRFSCEAHISIGFDCTVPLNHPQNTVLWKRDARMAFYGHTAHGNEAASFSSASASDTTSLKDFLTRASREPSQLEAPENVAFLASRIVQRVLSFLMRNDGDAMGTDESLSLSMASLGMDSLMMIEIRNWWRLTFGVNVSLLQLTSAANFEQLGKLAARQLKEKCLASGLGRH